MVEKILNIFLLLELQVLTIFSYPADQINIIFKITYNNFWAYYNA